MPRKAGAARSRGLNRRAALAVLALLAGLALVLGLLGPPPKRAPAAVVSATETMPPSPAPAPAPESVEPPAAQAAPAPEADPAPIIDSIVVEKPEVCAGEENLVTVHAHTPNGTDAFLHYVVDGTMGSSVPQRLWLDPSGRVQGEHVIRVFGRTNTAVTVPLPYYRVKECQPRRIATIEARLQPNAWSDFGFVARVVDLPPPNPGIREDGAAEAFVPASYTWSFGDGASEVTAVPVARHDYEGRAQDALYSYFTIGVEVRATDGRTLKGRSSLALVNPTFESFARKGIVQLLVALDPRFPELGPDGRVVQQVRLWHGRGDSVTIESATRTKYFESGAGETEPEAVDVAQLLGTTAIPPGRSGVTTRVVLDTVAEPGVFSISYRLAGHSADGHVVAGTFSVMRPPPRPTADNSLPVVDPVLKAKILAARELLGRDTVNDEDLWRLEREGRFTSLVAPSAPGAASGAAPEHATGAAAVQPAAAPADLRPPSLVDPSVPTEGPPVPTSVTPAPAVTSVTDLDKLDKPASP